MPENEIFLKQPTMTTAILGPLETLYLELSEKRIFDLNRIKGTFCEPESLIPEPLIPVLEPWNYKNKRNLKSFRRKKC